MNKEFQAFVFPLASAAFLWASLSCLNWFKPGAFELELLQSVFEKLVMPSKVVKKSAIAAEMNASKL
jgi:hypothetical protein